MAYTIQATPAAYSSVHDDLVYTVADTVKVADPVTYPNFKFIGDVYVGATLVARIIKVPDPVTGIGIFNIGPVLRSYLNTVFDPSPNILLSSELGSGAFNVVVTMKFGEQYSDSSFLNLTTDSARTFFNNYNGRLVGITSSLVPFTNKVASNKPLIGQTLLSSTYQLLSYFPTSTSAVPIVVTPTGGGSTLSTSVTPSAALNMLLINISPVALNAVAAGTITAATTKYTVLIGGITYTFNIICETVYQPRTVHFLNQYGGFDTKIFPKVSRTTYTVTKADFGKLPYTVDGSGTVSWKSANGVYNESRSTYYSQFTEALALNSDLLTDQEYAWLSDLIFSPMIYIEDGGYLFPCVITDTTYEKVKAVNDDLTALTVNIEYGTQLNAQFR
jgi:hypothetical protein